MAKPYRIPDFKRMYPEASEEVIEVLKITERKMLYQEYDLKRERIVIDREKQLVKTIPSREDSYERLIESSFQFIEQKPGIEEQVIHVWEMEQLYNAIACLPREDQYLIYELYFEERIERDLAIELKLSQKGINKRKKRILKRLKELMKQC